MCFENDCLDLLSNTKNKIYIIRIRTLCFHRNRGSYHTVNKTQFLAVNGVGP